MITLILAGLFMVCLIYFSQINWLNFNQLAISNQLSFRSIPKEAGERPALDWWGHPMRKSLRAYRAKKVAAQDFAIHYHIGGGLSGETDFRLWGDGNYDLWSTVTKGRQRKSYCGQMESCLVDEVVEQMLATKVWQVRHLYPTPALDDPDAMIAVKAGNQKSEVVLWVSEIRESPPFQKVQEQLLSLIHDVSQGEVLENGQ